MKVLYATSEAAPFIKTGGLGDVLCDLPVEVAAGGEEVFLVLPKYRMIPDEYTEKMEYVTHFYVNVGWRSQYCGILKLEREGVTVYFVDNESYFGYSGHLYGEILYDMERYAFFSKAVLDMLPHLDLKPDIIHVNDWETAMIPVMLDAHYRGNDYYKGIKTVITIHNLKYQGRYDKKTVADFCGLADYYFTPDKLEYYEDASFLKGGLVYADVITTVSPTYAHEITTPEGGEGLDGILRARGHEVRGILNGVDYNNYSPARDEMIYEKYNGRNFATKKKLNKERLQKDLGLPVDKEKIVIGMVTRLTKQKGIEIIESVIDALLSMDLQLIVLGVGEQKYHDMLKHFEWKYGDKLRAVLEFDESKARRIYAASDLFLMPSEFEPCGLSQIIAMKYGALPLVRETGGLKDTVTPYNEFENTGTGFSFASCSGGDMINVIKYAMSVFADKTKWNALVRRAMGQDFSWKKSAEQYIEIYRDLKGNDNI